MSAGVRRRVWAVVGAVVLASSVVSACSVEQTLPPPWCMRSGSGLIVAQSVTTASQIPCLTDLPKGWSVGTVQVDDRHTRVSLDSDRAGDGAAVLRFDDACDVTDAVRTPTPLPADRYDLIEQIDPAFRAQRFYVFPGGSVSWTFSFKSGAEASESVLIGDALLMVSREDLQRQLSETFVDESI